VPLSCSFVPYGAAARERLATIINDAKAHDAFSAVTVVVPTNDLAVSVRRSLGRTMRSEPNAARRRRAGLVGVRFTTVVQLADELAGPALRRDRTSATNAEIAVAHRLAAARGTGPLAVAAQSQAATEETLTASYAELSRLSDQALTRLAEASTRLGELVSLHRAARTLLRRSCWDEAECLILACQLGKAGAVDLGLLGTIVVYLPEQLERDEAPLLTALAEGTCVHVLIGRTGDAASDVVADQLRHRFEAAAARPAGARTAAAAGPVPRSLHLRDPRAPDRPSSTTTRIVTTSDADEEVRHAVRLVLDFARHGGRLDDVAIGYAVDQPYLRACTSQLSAAGIVHHAGRGRSAATSWAGRSLLSVLAIAPGELRRSELFAALETGPILLGSHPAPVVEWERVAAAAGVVNGRDSFDRQLERYEAEQRRAGDGSSTAIPRDRGHRAPSPSTVSPDAESAASLRLFVDELDNTLKALASSPRSWSSWSATLLRLLNRLLGGPRERSSWPESEDRAYERVTAALASLSRLDRLDPPGGSVPLEVVTRTLRHELESATEPSEPHRTGVTVAPIGRLLGAEHRLVILLGLAEGCVPRPTRLNPLFDGVDPGLSEAGPGPSAALRSVLEQRRQFFGVVAAAERLVCLVPRGDLRRSGDQVPSRFVVDLASKIAGRALDGDELLHGTEAFLEHIESFEAGLAHRLAPATDTELRLSELSARAARENRRGEPVTLQQIRALQDEQLTASAQVVIARASGHFTRFDGNLQRGGPRLTDEVTSASALERYLDCPLAFFIADVLDVPAREDPDGRVVLAPSERGRLVHRVLELVVRDRLNSTGGGSAVAAWDPSEREVARRHLLACYRELEARGRTGPEIFAAHELRTLEADLDAFIEHDRARQLRQGCRPVAVEASFGMHGSTIGPVEVAVGGERRVRLRGTIDRIDVDNNGAIQVLDYKTGSEKPYLGSNDTRAEPPRLQLSVYAVAARILLGRPPDAPAAAWYWFVSRRAGFALHGFEVTAAVLDELRCHLRIIVDEISAGHFPARPRPAPSFASPRCPYCDPDGLGTGQLAARFRTKWRDPALASLAALGLAPLSDASAGGGPPPEPRGEGAGEGEGAHAS
jgi:ATP-dependent helicase/nuclease subunit B